MLFRFFIEVLYENLEQEGMMGGNSFCLPVAGQVSISIVIQEFNVLTLNKKKSSEQWFPTEDTER